MASPSPDRSKNRNCTVAVTGKTFEKLMNEKEVESLHNNHRSNSLPAVQNKRGDLEISANTFKQLKEKQSVLKGRVRRGSIFLGSVSDPELEDFYSEKFSKEGDDKTNFHMHGILSSDPKENVPAASRKPRMYFDFQIKFATIVV
jgi:hypothetical protein